MPSTPSLLKTLFLSTGATPDREPDHSGVPGAIITHSPAASGQYIGSPGLAVLPSGDYLAKCDLFGPGSTERQRAVTRVFSSPDQGRSWQHRADVHGMYWASLFMHRGDAYLLGPDRTYGHTVLCQSTDEGYTWTQPQDASTGRLLSDGKFHCAPGPVVIHRGRLWRAMEDALGPGGWGHHFRSFMMSAPVDADLRQAEHWTCSNVLGRNPAWLEDQFGGWLEGNAVITRQGEIVNILRVDSPRYEEKAAVIRIRGDGAQATFDPDTGFIDFPGGGKKFTLRYDPVSQRYWSLTNYVPDRHRDSFPPSTRNTLALTCSADLANWTVRALLLDHPDVENHGFQYVDWLFEGEDLIAVSRTAYDDGLGGAHNFHDANYLTFHRFADFRNLQSEIFPEPTFPCK